MRRKILAVFLSLIFISTAFAQQNSVFVHDKYGHQLLLQINPKTGSAHRVKGLLPAVNQYGFLAKNLNQESIENLSAKFFSDYSSILKIDPAQMKLSKAETDGRMWFVTYKQVVNSIPVYGTEIGYTINKNGDIIALGADVYQNVNVFTVPKMTFLYAVAGARKSFDVDSAELKSPVELIIYPLSNGSSTTFYLTWKVALRSLRPLKDVTYFIDAENGQIVAQQNNIRDDVNGNVSGSYWPVRASDTPVRSGFWTTQIYMHNADYTYTSYTNSDNSGNYSVSIPNSGTWFFEFPLQNSWVKVYDYKLGEVKRTLTTSGSGILNIDWGASDSTSVRWLTTVVHDVYKNWFNYDAMDYQMSVYVNAVDQYGNPSNGWADGNRIGFGRQSGYYWARSSDVVYHEYTHNVIFHIYGSWIGNLYYEQGRAMDEGLADYFASAINNDPIQGEDVNVNRNLDNNTYRWDPNAGAHWNGQVIGGALWDLRQSVGSMITDFLVFKALQISPHAYDFNDFEYNVILADDAYYSGNHLSQIQTAFYNHGISVPILNVSISGPTTLSIDEQGTWTATASGGTGTYTYRWYLKSADPQTAGNWIGPLSSTNTYSTQMHSYDQYLYVRADVFSSNFYFGSSYRYVNCANCSGGPLSVGQPPDSSRVEVLLGYIPKDYIVEQNYPNPFNPSTKIFYSLPEENFVTLKIYDILGREVVTLVNEVKRAGRYEAEFDASTAGGGLSSGTYIYKLTAGNYQIIKKMQLVK